MEIVINWPKAVRFKRVMFCKVAGQELSEHQVLCLLVINSCFMSPSQNK